MGAIIYGIAQTRITLYALDSVTPTKRITLQKEDKEGLVLGFTPEGEEHNLGSESNYDTQFNLHGFRAQLEAKWSVGTDPVMAVAGRMVSLQEIWNTSTGQWGAATPINTALALSLIFTSSFQAPCTVEPHLDVAFAFKARPPKDKVFAFQDLKGVVHTKLDLTLRAVSLLDGLPDWATFWVAEGYADQDWVAMGNQGP